MRGADSLELTAINTNSRCIIITPTIGLLKVIIKSQLQNDQAWRTGR